METTPGNLSTNIQEATAIQASVFNPWPDVRYGVPVVPFLSACELMVECIGAFGMLLLPVKKDVEGNVNKLKKVYSENTDQFEYIQEIILAEKESQRNTATIALLWLKRALHFVYVVLVTLIEDAKTNREEDDISSNFLIAYELSLMKYHNILLQKAFKIGIKGLPGRRYVLSKLPSSTRMAALPSESLPITVMVNQFKPMMKNFEENLRLIFDLYHREGLDDELQL